MDQEKFDYLEALQEKIEQHKEGLRVGERLAEIRLIILDENNHFDLGATIKTKKNNKLFKTIQRVLIDYSSFRLLKLQKEFDEIK